MTADYASVAPVRAYFLDLQERICARLSEIDGEQTFSLDPMPGADGSLAQPRVLANGPVIEKAAVQFTHSIGASLPPAATERNPHLAGHRFQAVAISLIVHPRNPMAPTTHMNLRFFFVEADEPVWYFGGGFDLTPCYGFTEDVVHWHRTAKIATGRHYPAFKSACDTYFYLPHREECRGVGGIFFDDWSEGGFDASFDLVQHIGDAFLPAYAPLLEQRSTMSFDDHQRQWQLYRRGRYAEFNLVWDRGTRYGLQSGRRVESVLASLPPLAAWHYQYEPEPGSPEAALLTDFLPPRDWLDDAP